MSRKQREYTIHLPDGVFTFTDFKIFINFWILGFCILAILGYIILSDINNKINILIFPVFFVHFSGIIYAIIYALRSYRKEEREKRKFDK